MSAVHDCLLVISLPTALKEDLLDALREQAERVSGASIVAAEGFGDSVRLRSTMEQVRGRADRCLVQIIMAQADVEPVLVELRTQFATVEIAWWTVPVTGFGRFT